MGCNRTDKRPYETHQFLYTMILPHSAEICKELFQILKMLPRYGHHWLCVNLLHISVRRLSTAASSIRYSASLGGSATPAQHTRSTGLRCGQPVPLELSTRQLERSGSWQGQLQTSADCWRRIYLHCTEVLSVLEMFQDDTLYRLTYLLTYLLFGTRFRCHWMWPESIQQSSSSSSS